MSSFAAWWWKFFLCVHFKYFVDQLRASKNVFSNFSLPFFRVFFFLISFLFLFNSFCSRHCLFFAEIERCLFHYVGLCFFFQYFANTILRLSNVWLSWLKHFADVIWNVFPCVCEFQWVAVSNAIGGENMVLCECEFYASIKFI